MPIKIAPQVEGRPGGKYEYVLGALRCLEPATREQARSGCDILILDRWKATTDHVRVKKQ